MFGLSNLSLPLKYLIELESISVPIKFNWVNEESFESICKDLSVIEFLEDPP